MPAPAAILERLRDELAGGRVAALVSVTGWRGSVPRKDHPRALFLADGTQVGTVGGGCGYEHDKWIAPGDVVELEIEGIGVLKNTIVTAEQQAQKQNNAADAEGSKTTGMAATEGSYGFTC